MRAVEHKKKLDCINNKNRPNKKYLLSAPDMIESVVFAILPEQLGRLEQ